MVLPATLGRPRRHGDEFAFGDPATWGQPDVVTETTTRLYGPALIRAWDRLHPRLTHRIAWAGHDGALPIIEGTVIRLQVERLPSGATGETRVALALPNPGPSRNFARPRRPTAGPGCC
ncbi:hypothetical protein [Amycolatopsis sp. NBC_01286]|uniref:hypothetical protein n=1 Tax=Amycolatopsis sp. NBC_01286 TaxID=2903560 RepID=UPI002E1454DB|nr:hypothetical protein OG570_32815 [Amycolatopsis sp. NBC_01286]